ncbi:hypothetical protein [Nonomuraea wenchangensis]|uniref:Uncharacterized protein n=1 Tax=Nonomuraea wenchangensis TaxID=568860 RepID=A0A1I0LVQ4_9ACTN|nr:hypothetical protein [Nonomuraea wenchangensis]SEU46758.1 hypothetical protein SAMN05421811_127138 [Nonomuraea wenchangensis]
MNLPPIIHRVPTGRPSPADIGDANRDIDPLEQVRLVANALVQELTEYHHPWIPLFQVRDAATNLLTGDHATGTWHERTSAVYADLERGLLDGSLYDLAENEGDATTTVHAGRVASLAATEHLRRHDTPAWEVVHEVWAETLCRALDYLAANGHGRNLPRMFEAFDALDHYDAATGKALIQHLTAVPADDIATITPSQVLADARAAGARPEHVLDATAVAITSVLAPVAGCNFHDMLPDAAADVRSSAHRWLDETHDIDAYADGFTYEGLSEQQVSGMLDHVAEFARMYDWYADQR